MRASGEAEGEPLAARAGKKDWSSDRAAPCTLTQYRYSFSHMVHVGLVYSGQGLWVQLEHFLLWEPKA
jgi:hypothetical protein